MNGRDDNGARQALDTRDLSSRIASLGSINFGPYDPRSKRIHADPVVPPRPERDEIKALRTTLGSVVQVVEELVTRVEALEGKEAYVVPKTRAKFKCNEIAKREGWGESKFLYASKFSAVGGDSPENKKFFESSPCGTLEISTVREDHFEVGKTYYLDFTPAD